MNFNKILSASTLVLFALLVFSSFVQKKSIQTDVWEELEGFHNAIALTFHPAEDGDFEPIKKDSKELVEAAQKLSTSTLPVYFEKTENETLKTDLQNTFPKLIKECEDLHALVEKKATDEELLAALTNLHETYHHIEHLNHKAKKGKE